MPGFWELRMTRNTKLSSCLVSRNAKTVKQQSRFRRFAPTCFDWFKAREISHTDQASRNRLVICAQKKAV